MTCMCRACVRPPFKTTHATPPKPRPHTDHQPVRHGSLQGERRLHHRLARWQRHPPRGGRGRDGDCGDRGGRAGPLEGVLQGRQGPGERGAGCWSLLGAGWGRGSQALRAPQPPAAAAASAVPPIRRPPAPSCRPLLPPQVLRPSVIVKVSYFTINSMSLVRRAAAAQEGDVEGRRRRREGRDDGRRPPSHARLLALALAGSPPSCPPQVGTNFEWQRDTRPGGQSGSNTVDIAELGERGHQRLEREGGAQEGGGWAAACAWMLAASASTHGRPTATPAPLPPSPIPPAHPTPTRAGSKEQVQEVTQGLQRLDFYLTNVTHEQRYLYARTVRHLRTAESTKRRTLLYSMLLTLTIVAASLAQVGAPSLGWQCSAGGRPSTGRMLAACWARGPLRSCCCSPAAPPARPTILFHRSWACGGCSSAAGGASSCEGGTHRSPSRPSGPATLDPPPPALTAHTAVCTPLAPMLLSPCCRCLSPSLTSSLHLIRQQQACPSARVSRLR